MKTKSKIIIGGLAILGLMVAFTVTFFIVQSYSTTMRQSILELHFEEDMMTVFITDQTQFGKASRELTTVPIGSLIGAHDRLPETSMNDRIIAGTIGTEIEKAGTYITQNGDREFWYTIRGSEDQIITIELQDHEFDRITFVSESSKKWIEQVNKIVPSGE